MRPAHEHRRSEDSNYVISAPVSAMTRIAIIGSDMPRIVSSSSAWRI